MIQLIKHEDFWEAIFIGGNLMAFTLPNLFNQLQTIYNINLN